MAGEHQRERHRCLGRPRQSLQLSGGSMPGRVSAYGFLGRHGGSVRRNAYRMPSTVAVPLRDFRLYAVVLWPDPLSEAELLLSLKIQSKEGSWNERLSTPVPLRRYVPRISFDTTIACVPQGVRSVAGGFHEFEGESPYGWSSFVNEPDV